MNKIYYLYTHTRQDTGEVFYVGIGTTFKSGIYERSKEKSKARRNKHWRNIINITKYKVDIIKEFDNPKECCQAEINMIKQLGRRVNNTGSLVNISPGGHIWKDAIPVYEYTLNGNFVKEWKSAREASIALGISYSNIYQNKRCKQSRFKTFKTDKLSDIPYYSNNYCKACKKVFQFTKTGDFVKEYNSVTEASYSMNTKVKTISSALTGINNTALGYIWSYTKSCIIPKLIIQKDLQGNIIGKYTSLIDVKTKLNLSSHNSIDNAIKGKIQKKAYGCYWELLTNIKIDLCEDKTKNL